MYSLFVGVREFHAEAMLREESVTSQRYLDVARMRYGTSEKHQRGSSVVSFVSLVVLFILRVVVLRRIRHRVADIR